MLARSPSRRRRRRRSHCERQRLYRRRQEEGLLSISLIVTPEETGKLFRLGLLRESEVEDRAAIARALHKVIEAVEV